MAGALTERTIFLVAVSLVCLAGLVWWAWLIWDSRCRHHRLVLTHGDKRHQFEAECRDCGAYFKRLPKWARRDDGC